MWWDAGVKHVPGPDKLAAGDAVRVNVFEAGWSGFR
jgi:protein involved in polysaccharide export with SLBB domain